MSDDLVTRLRDRANGGMHWVTVERMATEAADRIEELEASLYKANDLAEERWKHMMAVHDAVWGKKPNTSNLIWPSFVTEVTARIEALEANRQHWQDCYTRKVRHELVVRARIEELEAVLEEIIEECEETGYGVIPDRVFERIEDAARKAINKPPMTAEEFRAKWFGAKKDG